MCLNFVFDFFRKGNAIALGIVLILLSAATSHAQSDLEMHDAYGRTLILHGLNTGGDAKHNETHQPWIGEEDVQREHAAFGFNCVRYLIFWGAIEPEKDKYNEAYLQEVKKRVEWYTDRHMYVILDMHQDVFGYGVGGNGAPAWASAHTVIQNLIPDKWPWWMQNMEPKVIRSYVQFFTYKKHKDRQDHYILCWQKVAKLFANNPYVLGYDLMNEPHGGKIVKTLAGGFERRQLSAFYKRLIPAIRSVDTTRYIFFEPRSFGVNFGMKAHLPRVYDTKTGDAKLVYAPHCYPKFVDIPGEYSQKYKNELSKWYHAREREQAMHHTPMMLGEFGLSPSKKGYYEFLRDLNRQADSIHMSWVYWSNSLGGWSPLTAERRPSPILWTLLRVFPQATAGRLLSYSFDPDRRVFQMDYVSDARISQPTEIAIPRCLYLYGYDIEISGAKKYRTEVGDTDDLLKVYIEGNGEKVHVSITPQ